MNNPFDELTEALATARSVQYAARQQANAMGSLLVGNLRWVNGSTLESLKRELQGFNIQTHRWQKP